MDLTTQSSHPAFKEEDGDENALPSTKPESLSSTMAGAAHHDDPKQQIFIKTRSSNGFTDLAEHIEGAVMTQCAPEVTISIMISAMVEAQNGPSKKQVELDARFSSKLTCDLPSILRQCKRLVKSPPKDGPVYLHRSVTSGRVFVSTDVSDIV